MKIKKIQETLDKIDLKTDRANQDELSVEDKLLKQSFENIIINDNNKVLKHHSEKIRLELENQDKFYQSLVKRLSGLHEGDQSDSKRVKELEKKLKDQKLEISKRDQQLSRVRGQLFLQSQELQKRRQDLAKAFGWLDRIQQNTKLLAGSKSWKMTNMLRQAKQVFSGDQKRGPLVPIQNVLNAYSDWKSYRQKELNNLQKQLQQSGSDLQSQDLFKPDWTTLNKKHEKPHLLFIGHLASQQLYGSELTLIEIIQAVDRSKYKVFCLFPEKSQVIIEHIEDYTDEIILMRYNWWQDNTLSRSSIENFISLMLDKEIDLVWANTITMLESLVAAKILGIPSAVNPRELIDKDKPLTECIGPDAETIVEIAKTQADIVIANSKATSELFNKPQKTYLLYDAMDMDRYSLPSKKLEEIIKVGLVSSSLPKKGIEDFALLAKMVKDKLPNFKFYLIGPFNNHTDDLERRKQTGELTNNLEFIGYQANFADCYKDMDIVINFSHFAESFGRTAMEAMAFRRPIICYAWGALVELVQHGKTGFLIPYREYDKAIEYLEFFAKNPKEMEKFGKRGYSRVQNTSPKKL